MKILHLENENFDELIQEKILVDFYANWCGPCKMLAPVLEKVNSELTVVKVDVDKFEKIAQKYAVMSIPTLILFNKGAEQKKHIGFASKEQIEKFLQ